MHILLSYAQTFFYLCATQLYIFKSTFVDKLVNLYIWVTITLLISAYLLPQFGITPDYGLFMIPATIASAGLFELFPRVMNLVHDFESDRVTLYQLTLPLPSWLFFAHLILVQTIMNLLVCVCAIPLCKVILWNQFSLSTVNWTQFATILLVGNIFYSTFALWLTSRIKNILVIENAWARFLYPLMSLGGFQFSWKALYAVSPTFAYVNYFNPLTHIMEAMRAALLGQAGYLAFWPSIGILIFFSVVSAWWAFIGLQKKLDYL